MGRVEHAPTHPARESRDLLPAPSSAPAFHVFARGEFRLAPEAHAPAAPALAHSGRAENRPPRPASGGAGRSFARGYHGS